MDYELFALTDTGRARENNEDSVAIKEAAGLAVLADGMGGYNAGEVASGMTTAFISSELGRWLGEAGEQAKPREVKRAIEICVDNANRSVYNAANSNPSYSGMGTTLVIGVFHGRNAILGHIGDSRAYRYRDGCLTQVTRDHSLLQEQLDAGLITEEEAATASHRNLVTRALGVDPAVAVEFTELDVQEGDLYLMCSDGLSDMIDDRTMEGLLLNGGTLPSLAGQLISAANNNGGRDNISVILVRAFASAKKQGLLSRLLRK